MVSSKQQSLLLDKTKKACWAASDLFNSAKESGGNFKATHIHQDIDEQSMVLETSLQELLDLVEKLAPNMGVMSNVVHSIQKPYGPLITIDPPGKENLIKTWFLYRLT